MTFTLTSGGGGGTSGDQPFGGTPAAVPGTVQAANYDTGGQGVAYNVAAVNGCANSYRSDGVDLEARRTRGHHSAAAYDMGWTAPGQWFKYTVQVATAGTYTVSLRVAAPSAVTDALHIANSSGTNLSGSVAVPSDRRLPDLDHGHGHRHPAGGRANADRRPGRRRLESALSGLYPGFGRRRRWHRPDRVLRHAGPRARPADHGLLDPGRHRLPGARRHRRRPRHPLVQPVKRPAVAGCRPRLPAADLQREHPLGGRLRLGVPGPGVQRQRDLDQRSTPRRPAPAGPRRSPLPRPTATSASTPPPGVPSSATRSSSSTSTG